MREEKRGIFGYENFCGTGQGRDISRVECLVRVYFGYVWGKKVGSLEVS